MIKEKRKGNMNNRVNFENQCKESLEWVKEMGDRTNYPNREDWAFNALRSVLHTIRVRTTIEEAFHLAAQLPVVLRGYFFEGYRPSAKKEKMNADQFLSRISKGMGPSNELTAEKALGAVLGVLVEHISTGEIDNIKHSMPKDIKTLWERELQNASVW